MEFFIQNLDFVVGPNNAMKSYYKNRMILYVMFLVNLFFESILTVYLYRNKEFLLIQLNEVYRGYDKQRQILIFESLVMANLSVNLVCYVISFYAIFSHRVTNYQIMLFFMLVGMMLRVGLCYVNVMNVFMLVLKIFTFVFAKYVLSLLYAVLLVPEEDGQEF